VVLILIIEGDLMNYSRFFLISLLLVIPLEIVLAQNTLTFLDGAISFQRPANVTLWEERPRSTIDPNFQNFWWGRIQLAVDIFDEQALRNKPPTMMSQTVYDLVHNNDYLLRDSLLNLFAEKHEFIIFPCTPRVDIRKSYKSLRSNGIIIGESFFHANAKNLEARGNFGYTTSIVIENKIVNIYLSLFIGEENNPLAQLDRYFVTRNNELYWIDDKAQISFYDHLSSDGYNEMPLILQQLREAYDFILSTMEIRQEESDGRFGEDRFGIDIIRPSLEFQRTHLTTGDLQLFERADDGAPTILTLPEGTDVQVIMVSNLTRTRIGVPFPWVIVTTREGYVGWCFSGYLISEEDYNKRTLIAEDIPVIINEEVTGSIDIRHEQISTSTVRVVTQRPVRVWPWLLLLLLIPLTIAIVFFRKNP
jgi:uncharacterized protein with PQ loop repeat